MQEHYFSHEAYICRVDDGAIVLDCNTNKYYSVDPAELVSVNSHTTCSQRHEEESCALLKGNSHRPEFPDYDGSRLPWARLTPCCLETAGLITLPRYNFSPPSMRFEYILAFSRSFLHVTMSLRIFSLQKLLDRFRSSKSNNSYRARRAASIPLLVDAFRRIRPWVYTAKEHCLLDSLILTDYLLRFGAEPTFVIGVRTKPFAAHAWVQDTVWVVDDCAEKVQGYTPILAV